MNWKCDGNWRTCGFCKVAFDGPFDSARPACQKAGFLQMLLGGDWCPYAPDPDLSAGIEKDNKPKQSQFIFTMNELKRWLANGNVAKSVEKLEPDKYLVTESGAWYPRWPDIEAPDVSAKFCAPHRPIGSE